MKNRTRLLAGLLSLLLLFTSMPVMAAAGETFVPTKKAKDGALVGDVNKDNAVDATDRMLLARYLAGWEGYEEKIKSKEAADIDGAGDITAKDRMLLARFLAGWDGYEEYFTGYLVTFDGNSFDVENLPEPQTVKPGEYAAEPAEPTKPIHVFTGWYTDEDCTAKFDFSTPVTDNLTLYAGWECEIYSKDLDEAHVREEEFEIDGETGTFTFVDNQLVVVVEDGVTRETLEATLSAYRGVIVGQIPDVGYYQVEFPEARAGADLQAFADELTACAGIEEAFINLVLDYEPQYDYNPNDTFLCDSSEEAWKDPNTWHLRATKTREAWDIVDEVYKRLDKRPSIRMGVLDHGITEHTDINFISIDNSRLDPESAPTEFEHGTHVAGIMGAIHNNENLNKNDSGIAGVAIGAEIRAVSMGGLSDWYEVASLLSSMISTDCKIINMSQGIIIDDFTTQINALVYASTYLSTEIAALHAADLLQKKIDEGFDFLIVTAAGNNGEYLFDDTSHNNFLGYIRKSEIKKRIIVVGNAEQKNSAYCRRYDSSYRGDRVDVMAPGSDILSTVQNNSYKKLSGTSMASPFVAGLAGLIWEANPSLSAERVKEIICETATTPVEDSEKGMVNCQLALVRALNARYIPVMFKANGGSGTMENKTTIVIDFIRYTLPECEFTAPEGKVFKAWRIGNEEYTPGEDYTHPDTGGVGLIFDAIWEDIPQETFVFHFDSNGGSGTMEDESITLYSGSYPYVLPDCYFEAPEGKEFKGWRIDGVEYAPGTVYTITAKGSAIVYAVWAYDEEPDHGEIVDSGACGNSLTWTLYEDGTLAIYGNGPMSNYRLPTTGTSNWSPFFKQLDNIKSVVISEGVTSIGNYAFVWLNLNNVTIPNSVTSIGNGAFSMCNLLTSVIIPNSVTSIGKQAFSGCTSLTSVSIPNSVTSIEYSAFQNCASLTNVTIPNSVTNIGENAFHACKSLTSVIIPNSVTTIKKESFRYCTSLTSVTISDGVAYIDNSAFSYCTSLTNVTIPNSVTEIREEAFYNCTSLTSLTIPDGVAYIGNAAFRDCTSLMRVVIPNSMIKIGDNAFRGCTSLTSMTIPDGVTNIGDYAFSDCTSLTSLTIPATITSFGNRAFNACSSLTSVRLKNGLTTIGSSAFLDCTSLTSVIIPDSVISIENYAFSGCTSLKSVTIPNSVTSIGKQAFIGCTSLKSVTIPNSVTSIGNYAFSDCTSLTSFLVYSNNPNFTSEDGVLFNKNKTLLITFPAGKTGTYTIPSSVANIEVRAFYHSSMTSVTIPNSVTSIGAEAFAYSSLTSVTIPNSVTSIGNWAFEKCTSLSIIRFQGNAPSFESSTFSKITTTAYYPANDASWIEAVRQNYGGNITWVAY